MKINKEELHEIFEGIKNNDELKFNELYTKYYKLIYSIALSILKNKENSEDVAQTIFTKIYSLPKKQLPKQGEASWLYTTTKNESINYLKKVRNDTCINNVYFMTEDSEIEDIISKDAYNRIMSKLDEKEREIVSLKIIGGLSFRQISKLISMPMGTVQWKYYKSLNTIKMLLTNLCVSILAIGIFVLRRIGKKEESTLQNSNINNENNSIINDTIISSEQESSNTFNKDNNMQQESTSSDIGNSSIEQNNDSEKDISIQENVIKEDANIQENIIEENANIQENIIGESVNIQENIISEQEKTEFISKETTTDNQVTLIDIGLLSVFAIFFILTIFVTITAIKKKKRAGRKLK